VKTVKSEGCKTFTGLSNPA